jgi:hypothetical protein
MTVREFNNEFDIHYNSIAGQSAPNLDAYEKSVYLTKAQLELVKDHYDPSSNKKQKGFEATEKRRVDLKELIKDYKTTISFLNNSKISNESRFFNIPQDVFLIINEQVKLTSSDCNNNKVINVKPITHDEFNLQYENPFKTPDNSVAWRLDYSQLSSQQVVEIISPYNISGSLEYRLRYIKQPKPIILEDLSTLFPGENLSIDGITAITNCELHKSFHREIIDRAVEIAIKDYKPANLEGHLMLNQRNE